MLKAVLFDLDDTLYPEWDYVRGGFEMVAQALSGLGAGPAPELVELLKSLHYEGGREGVFDRAVRQLGFSGDLIPDLVDLYRRHPPTLELSIESRTALEHLRGRYRVGCVTDGFAEVQRRKIESLGIASLCDAIVVADELGGRDFWKPDPRPFLHCCQLLEVVPEESVFVGDNPERDMVGARKAGLRAIRMRRPDGYFRDRPATAGVRHEITSLSELPGLLASTNQGPRS